MIKKLIYISLFVLISASCKKGFDELNQNPNAITKDLIDPEYLFPKAVIASFAEYNVGVNTELWAMMTWTQMVASKNVVSLEEEFQYGGSDVDLVWSTFYSKALVNCEQVIRFSENDGEQVNTNAIATIWKAYLFHIVTDLWGDVPYLEALQGDSEQKILYPKYDSQKFIYEQLLQSLEGATARLDASKNTLSADIIYAGDVEKWKKFANTLRLRLALRIYDANQTLATEHIQSVINENNFIASTVDAAYFDYSYGDNLRSPIAEGFRQAQVSELPSQLFVNTMLNDNDPRISYMIEQTKEFQVIGIFDEFVGARNFSSTTQDGFYLSNFNSRFIGGDGFESPEARPIITLEESLMLQAEAALKGFGGSAQDLLLQGVEAHMNYLEVEDSLIQEYKTELSNREINQELISTEKWKTFFMRDGFEAYAEWRRTGFPKVLDENGSELDQAIVPTRLPLPDSEISRNENINDLSISPTNMKSKVWWDVN